MTSRTIFKAPTTDPDRDNRLHRAFKSRGASVAFVAIVFCMVALQVLANPLAVLFSGGEAVWEHDLSLPAISVIITLACAIQASALFLSPRSPVSAALATVVIYVAAVLWLEVPTWITSMSFVAAIAMFLLGAQRSPRVTVSIFAVVCLAATASMLFWALSTGAPLGVVSGYVLERSLSFVAPVSGATALGIWWGIRSRSLAHAEAAAADVAREQDARIEGARLNERTRIAQELHDVAGQHIAGLLSLADAAIAIEVKDPEQALSLIEDIRSEGRFASASLYAALRDLRAVDGERVERTPDVASLDELVAYWTKRGMKVSADVQGRNVSELPAIVSTTTYRAVQEALTNAAKHASGAEVTVTVKFDSSVLRATVLNGPTVAPAEVSTTPGLGWGLEAMAQRVLMLGGTFDARPTDDGGWLVSWEAPLQDSDSPREQS